MLSINFETFSRRQRIGSFFLLYAFLSFSFFIRLEALDPIALEDPPGQEIFDFCLSSGHIYMISEDYTLYKYQEDRFLKKHKIIQKISKHNRSGTLNSPKITCYKDSLYVHEAVYEVKVYDKDLNFIKFLPVKPFFGIMYIKNYKIIYLKMKSRIGKLYYYDLIKNKTIFISDANNADDVNARSLGRVLFIENKYYIYLHSHGRPTKGKILVFDSKFAPVRGKESILELFSSNQGEKMIIKDSILVYKESIIRFDSEQDRRFFKTTFGFYDPETLQKEEFLVLNDMLSSNFFLKKDVLYYLSNFDGILHRFSMGD
ncbi:hypothetical protein PN36_34955 [Candidatus Thiomargarita nelsonii]|uniref:Uncharacterized protein n=1 Tax=Candidatus Thiomargarita nelsonii TaxID=1003181 RepID=A0A4E0RKQ6_9GAMM|nr:hypothetical protein PN36_34955 [Candidatus Thiomargarita nelsonii]